MKQTTIYYLRSKEGLYYTIDKDGTFATSKERIPVAGVPEGIKDADFTKPLTFTGQARNILTRIFFNHGDTEAICFVSFGKVSISLNFSTIRIRTEHVTIACHAPVICHPVDPVHV